MKKLLLLPMVLGMSLTGPTQNDLAKTNFSASAFLKNPEKKMLHSPESPATAGLKTVKTAEHWKKLKRNGIIMTGGGIACIAGGLTLIVIGNNKNNSAGPAHYMSKTNVLDFGDDEVFAGTMGIAGGLIALGGGITMWTIGNNRLKKYTGRVSFDVGGQSAKLAYRF